eukprot:Nitzschia sp. Nitz4//scaffold217_size45653//21347//24329//NITZ4_007224-RA/size45653-snap-gene-0.78-mRNA-1//1//CDS//3329542237//6878//frame0
MAGCGLAVSFQLVRLSLDLVQTASQSTSKDYNEAYHGANQDKKPSKELANGKANGPITSASSKNNLMSNVSASETTPLVAGETSAESDAISESSGSNTLRQFLGLVSSLYSSLVQSPIFQWNPSNRVAVGSFWIQCVLVLLFILSMPPKHATLEEIVVPRFVVWTAWAVVLLGALLTIRDLNRQRFGVLSRFFYSLAASTMFVVILALPDTIGDSPAGRILEQGTGFYFLLSLVECFCLDFPKPISPSSDGPAPKKTLSRAAMLTMLKPYFWPDETSTSAWLNRARAMLTWVCVVLSKVCNVISPIFLGWASTALAHQQYAKCIYCAIAYSVFQFLWSFFKEGQSLIYLKVAQAAFVQLSETTFVHLHNLSLDWHLKKKLGEVVRSVDRGVAACDTLMKFLFLWLIPALVECAVVCVIFATYFQYAPLAVSVFYFVWFYIVWTILVTLWRKKFRKAVVLSDNEWHDRCTDSLINFETVKYFTAEKYEAHRFAESVQRYREGSVNVQASLSFLNVSQQFILQVCLAFALSLAALGIKKRVDCCVEVGGCDSGVSDCCLAIDRETCPGMQVGDFVAVLAYVIQLFTPLNFLGGIYNAIVMAVIDLTNLSELLAEDPDVVDANDAIPLPATNETDPDTAVEFDNVVFHYPSQPSNLGLKGLSFKMKRGTTTAIVGPTGAGKTTVSRLLFRFYDVLGGAVKVNGKDVRIVQQQSLRQSIGAVAQSSSLFSDTIKANLLYGKRDASEEELEQAARDAQLWDFISSLDDGWETLVGDRGLKLSGGERQRASIARCLLKDPPFVVLDEATSALDTLTENSVQEALDRLGTERTVLVIAHRLGTIRNADNIVVLKDGVVAEEGSHDMLMAKDGLYAEMWNMQLTSSATGAFSAEF